ncbi:hypothetical protein BDW74DRAFT_174803 [Aspergillus multicolor]|uniref:uncharacterized protein n=1 Tax=Aspergillus multicolor TaxID=41759 RepID=UPI003CCE19C9
MALCVWTAVHPNIPVTYIFWPVLLERMGLMVLAIVFPEFILTAALDERKSATRLLADVNTSFGYSARVEPRTGFTPKIWLRRSFRRTRTILEEDSVPLAHLPSATNTSPFPQGEHLQYWTFEYAIFGVMGGFGLETRYKNEQNEHRTLRRIITPRGLSILAKVRCLPSIKSEEIEERSKADIFAKAAVVGQILWFALQAIGPLFQGLPVTPLETHTTIHVGCAMVSYAIWIRKPYNLVQCIVVAGPDLDCIGALFNFYDISNKVFRARLTKYEEDRSNYWKQRVVESSRVPAAISELPPSRPVLKPIGEQLEQYQSQSHELRIESDEKTQILYALPADASRGLQILESRGCFDFQNPPFRPDTLQLLRQGSRNFTIRTIWGGWSTDIGHEPSTAKTIHVLFNVLYGGFHCLAWSSFFPTTIEQWLWRGSALFLLTVPIWAALWILWWKALRSSYKALYLVRSGDLDIIAAPLFFLVMVAYTLARCYFLVEALAGLRLLPATAYQTVQWAEFLPHVT